MLTLRSVCLAALALSAASPASAQINITIGRPRHWHPIPPYLGTVSGYRVPPAVFVPPALGVVTRPVPAFRPVRPVVSLSPTIYSGAYLSRFSPGFQTILVGNDAYYYYPSPPPGATFVTVGGVGYFTAGGVWYQPYSTGDRNLFLVVPPPI